MRIGLSVRKIFLLAAVLLAAALPTGARAQTIDLDATRVPISPVDSAWRFHLGDNARWAQPEFDDSTWPTLQPQPIGPNRVIPSARSLPGSDFVFALRHTRNRWSWSCRPSRRATSFSTMAS